MKKYIKTTAFAIILCCLYQGIFGQVIIDTALISNYNNAQQFYSFKPNLNIPVNTLITNHKSNFRVSANNTLVKINEVKDSMLGGKNYRYQQQYNNIPIENSMLNVLYNSTNNPVNANGATFDNVALNTTPAITTTQAITTAIAYLPATKYYWQDSTLEAEIKEQKNDTTATYYPKPILVILPIYNASSNTYNYSLCYKVLIQSFEPSNTIDVFIDANSGLVISTKQISSSCSLEGKNKECYEIDTIINHREAYLNIASCNVGGCKQGVADLHGYGYQYINTDEFKYGIFQICTFRLKDNCTGTTLYTRRYTYPGKNVLDIRDGTNNWASGGDDKIGATAHWSIERTHDFYRTRYGRNSWDGNNSQLSTYINMNTDKTYANGDPFPYAGFTGNSIVVTKKYNLQNAKVFLDILGHEFTHGVTLTSAYLTYEGESGALNEGFSDIFGTMIEFYGETNYSTGQSPNYTFGELADGTGGYRNLANPKDHSNPDTYMGTYWKDPTNLNDGDQGGVHTNSGLLGYWFYLVAEGSSATDGINDNNNQYCVQGIGKDKVSDIAYRTLTTKLYPSANYSNCMFLTIKSAEELYGVNSNEVAQVMAAWYAVGVDPYPQFGIGQIDIKNVTMNTPQSYHYNKKVTLQNVTTNPTAGLVVTSNTEIELINDINFNNGSDNELYITPACTGGARMGNPNSSANSNTDVDNTLSKTRSNQIIKNDFIVMPNPTTGVFKLQTNSDLEYPKQITIRDVLGQTVYDIENPNSFENEFNLSKENAGIYMINVFYNDKVMSKRIIKE